MQVNFNSIDDLNATITVDIEKNDYAEKIETELKKLQKKAVLKGFRQGAAPMGIVKNMYGKSILAEEINKLASQALFDYLKVNQIDILAQPIESESIKSDIDIEKNEKFTFAFDLGLAPKFEVNISEKDTLDKYVIEIDDSEVEKEIEQLSIRYGELVAADKVSEKDIVYANATELNEQNEELEGGVANKPISFTPEMINDESLRNQLIGATANSTLTVDIKTLFNNNETVISNSLGINKAAVSDLYPNFKLEITEIKSKKVAEINQELFDKVLGEGVANSLEEFKEKIKENINAYYKNESQHQVEHMITHLIADKHDFDLPDAFLKRWLLASKNEHYTTDNVDERYAAEAKTLREVLVREKIAAKYEMKIEKQDIEQTSLGYTFAMFRNYGLQNPDFEMVKKFSDESLKKPDYIQQMNDLAIRKKVYDKITEIVSYNEIKVSIEDFYKAIQAHNEEHKH